MIMQKLNNWIKNEFLKYWVTKQMKEESAFVEFGFFIGKNRQ